LSLVGTLALAACSSAPAPSPSAALDLGLGLDPASPVDLAPPPDASFATAAHPPLPELQRNAGDVIRGLRLVSVVASGDPLAQALLDFGDALVASSWWTAIGADYGLGAATGSLGLTGPAIDGGTNLGGARIKSYLTALATGSAAPDGHSVYVLYLPSGVGILDNNNQPIGGCVAFHFGNFDAKGDVWAVVKRCGTPAGDSATYLASHEIAEGCADAAVGKGWSLPFAPSGTPPWMQDVWAVGEGHEASDLCQGAGATRQGGHSYARIWSNTAAAAGRDPCLPSLPGPYVNVSAPSAWIRGAPGQDVVIPITGWSSAPVDDWSVQPGVRAASGAGFVTRFDGDGGTATINNGQQRMLHVQVPPDAGSGDYCVARLLSTQPASAMELAIWLVGVYVP
jgi:hypothetical protein